MKQKTRKTVGVLCLLLLPIILVLYTVSRIIFSSLGETEVIDAGTGLAEASLSSTLSAIINVILSLFGLLALIVGIPLGIILLAKKDTDMAVLSQKEAYKGLSPDQLTFVDRWSWGAFLGGPIWAVGNKLYVWAVLGLLPIVNVYAMFKLGSQGRKMAWEEGGWQGFEQFKHRQQIMAWIILAFFIFSILAQFLGGDNV